MNTITLKTIDLLKISYLANYDSLIRIKSNKNILNITLDKFSRANARLEFGIDVEKETNIDVTIKASDFIAATDNIVDIPEYQYDFERYVLKDYEQYVLEHHEYDFSELEAYSTLYFDVKKIAIVYKNNEYTIDNIEIDFEKKYDVKKESRKQKDYIRGVIDYLNIIRDISYKIEYINYKGACLLTPKSIYEEIVFKDVLLGHYSYIEFEDVKQAYKDFLIDMKLYYNITATNNELLSESELQTIGRYEIFSIEINVNSRGRIDKLIPRELKFRKLKSRVFLFD